MFDASSLLCLPLKYKKDPENLYPPALNGHDMKANREKREIIK